MHSEKLSLKSLILLEITPLLTNSIRPTLFLSLFCLARIYPILSRVEQSSLEVNFVWLFEDLLFLLRTLVTFK